MNDIDTYLRLRYGNSLTEESYDNMPDELVKKIYLDFHHTSSTILNYKLENKDISAMRENIHSIFSLRKNFPNFMDNGYCSEKVWNMIKEYHERNN